MGYISALSSISDTTTFSMSAWIWSTQTGLGNIGRYPIFNIRQPSSAGNPNDHFRIEHKILSDDDTGFFHVRAVDTAFEQAAEWRSISTSGLEAAGGIPNTVDRWYHLAVAVDTSVPKGRIHVNTIFRNKNDSEVPHISGTPVIPWSGSTMFVPGNPTGFFNNELTRLDRMQIWLDQYIDFSDPDNMAKFVSIREGIGRPGTGAVAAFGDPTLSFSGGKEAFHTNRGTGDAFARTGTLTDFTPTPSFTV